jgi:hypothetical protein
MADPLMRDIRGSVHITRGGAQNLSAHWTSREGSYAREALTQGQIEQSKHRCGRLYAGIVGCSGLRSEDENSKDQNYIKP